MPRLKRLPFERGELTLRKGFARRPGFPTGLSVCVVLRRLLDTVGTLTENDRRFIDAIVRHGGNSSAAAREIAPRRAESCRVQIQQRLARYRALLVALTGGLHP